MHIHIQSNYVFISWKFGPRCQNSTICNRISLRLISDIKECVMKYNSKMMRLHTWLDVLQMTEITIMKDFRNTFLNTFTNTTFDDSSLWIDYFVHTCYVYGHLYRKVHSTCSSLVEHNMLNNKTTTQAVTDWYFDKSEFEHMDICNDLPQNCTFILLCKSVHTMKCHKLIAFEF